MKTLKIILKRQVLLNKSTINSHKNTDRKPRKIANHHKIVGSMGCIKTCWPGFDPGCPWATSLCPGWLIYIKRIPPGWELCPTLTWGAPTDTWLGKLWGGGWCIWGCGLWWWCPRGNCWGCPPAPGGGGGCCILTVLSHTLQPLLPPLIFVQTSFTLCVSFVS